MTLVKHSRVHSEVCVPQGLGTRAELLSDPQCSPVPGGAPIQLASGGDG